MYQSQGTMTQNQGTVCSESCFNKCNAIGWPPALSSLHDDHSWWVLRLLIIFLKSVSIRLSHSNTIITYCLHWICSSSASRSLKIASHRSTTCREFAIWNRVLGDIPVHKPGIGLTQVYEILFPVVSQNCATVELIFNLDRSGKCYVVCLQFGEVIDVINPSALVQA